MTIYGTFQGKHYKFYLVDACYNYQDSPFGPNTICIPVFRGCRTNCARMQCELCELREISCQSLFSKFSSRTQQLFSDITDKYPELLL